MHPSKRSLSALLASSILVACGGGGNDPITASTSSTGLERADDNSTSQATAELLTDLSDAFGTSLVYEISPSNDVDFFEIQTGSASITLTLSSHSADTNGNSVIHSDEYAPTNSSLITPLSDPSCTLRLGNTIIDADDNSGPGRECSIVRSLSPNTTYHLEVESADGESGDYRIHYSWVES